MQTKIKVYASLFGCYFIYSLSLVAARFAAEYALFSFEAVMFYGLAFFLLGIFALIWQQVLKRMSLVAAHASRAITILYGLVWGFVLFAEEIRLNMILGIAIIIAGIILMVVHGE